MAYVNAKSGRATKCLGSVFTYIQTSRRRSIGLWISRWNVHENAWFQKRFSIFMMALILMKPVTKSALYPQVYDSQGAIEFWQRLLTNTGLNSLTSRMFHIYVLENGLYQKRLLLEMLIIHLSHGTLARADAWNLPTPVVQILLWTLVVRVAPARIFLRGVS